MTLKNRLKKMWYSLCGYEITYRYVPTKATIEHAKYIKNLKMTKDDLLNTNKLRPTDIGPSGIWVVSKSLFKINKKALVEHHNKEAKYTVRSQDAINEEYNRVLRKTIVDSMNANRTVH